MIELDKHAAEALREHIESSNHEGAPGLRIAVIGGGCSGFQYRLLLDEASEDDIVFTSQGEKIICDPDSVLYVDGSTITYESSLQESGFSVQNPRATSSCGCGSSFHFAGEDTAPTP